MGVSARSVGRPELARSANERVRCDARKARRTPRECLALAHSATAPALRGAEVSPNYSPTHSRVMSRTESRFIAIPLDA